MTGSDPTVTVLIHYPVTPARVAAGISMFVAIWVSAMALVGGFAHALGADLPDLASGVELWAALGLLVICTAPFALGPLFGTSVEVRKHEGDLSITTRELFWPRFTSWVRSEQLRGARWQVCQFKRDSSYPAFRPLVEPRIQLVSGRATLRGVGVGLTLSEAQAAADALNRLLER